MHIYMYRYIYICIYMHIYMHMYINIYMQCSHVEGLYDQLTGEDLYALS